MGMRWEFVPNPGGEEEGLGHAGIETFKSSRYPGIARESSQNSIDAAAKLPDGASTAVHLVFRHMSLPAAEIPDIQSLRATLQVCLDQAKTRNLKKDLEFFERAIAVANASHIPVLSVEDYGTTGLLGPMEPGKPFYALVKSSGVSQKPDPDAGGSFGIGKNAAFAISSLRTVLYSTLYEDSGTAVHLTQGKSILVSHSQGGEKRRAAGYLGQSGFEPVYGTDEVPKWLARSEIGTTVATIGFIEESNWHWQVVESLIRNFFSAVHERSVSFTVDAGDGQPVEITTATLGALFENPSVLEAAETAGTTEDLQFGAAMLAVLSSDAIETHEESFPNVGKFRLRLLQRDGFPKRIGILRNGMYIADNLKHFNQPLARFNLSRDFVAILEPADKATSGRVRDMESPKHDEISAERFDDVKEREKIRRSMKKVGQWIRDIIKASTTKPAEAEVLLDEMNKFFSRPGDTSALPDPNDPNTDPEKIRLKAKLSTTRPVGAGPEGASGSAGGQKSSGTKGGRTTGSRAGGGRGSNGGRGGRNITYTSLRNVVLASGDGASRLVSFTPDASGTALMEFLAVGVAKDEALGVLEVDGRKAPKMPRIMLQEGRRESMTILFDQPYTGPIRMVLAREDVEHAG